MNQINKSYKKQSGFTLLESVLTLFILTIGILGVAGLQMEGMRSASLAMQRTIVTLKTQDLLDRMRANTINAAAYASTTAAPRQCNSGTDCTGADMVAHDLYMWGSDLDTALPGTVTRTVQAASINAGYIDPATGFVVNHLVTITVTWSDRGTAYTYEVATQI